MTTTTQVSNQDPSLLLNPLLFVASEDPSLLLNPLLFVERPEIQLNDGKAQRLVSAPVAKTDPRFTL